MKPWEMVLAHRHEEAAACYEAALQSSPDDPELLSSQATNSLCLERLDEALMGFQKANAIASQQMHGQSQPYLTDIGAVLWLLGRREEAIQTLRVATYGIVTGAIKYGDNAGGVSPGLLLWYFGVTAADQTTKDLSLKFLHKIAKKRRIKEWPGALGRFVLGEKTQQDLLVEVCGTGELRGALRRATKDLLTRRDIVKTIFYLATQRRNEGAEEECRATMVQCATLENPILEVEWYLARAEAK